MGWPLAIAAGVVAGVQIAGGYISAGNARRNSQIAQQYALHNSYAQYSAAKYTAQAMMTLGAFNAQLALMGGALQAGSIKKVSKYNAEIVLAASKYNSDALLNEISLIWEGADLEIDQMGHEIARQKASVAMNYVASGVEINSGGTPRAVAEMLQKNYELDKFVVRHNGEIQAKKLMDQAAISRWEGETRAAQIIFEGEVQALNAAAGSQIAAGGAIAQAGIDAAVTMYNGGIQAWQTFFSGQAQASQYSSAASQAITTGFLNGASSLAMAYGGGAFSGLGKTGAAGSTAASINTNWGGLNYQNFGSAPSSVASPYQSLLTW